MRWPWQGRTERRSSAGDFTDLILRAVEADQAAESIDVAATAAVEAAAGALSRAFAGATVEGPDWAMEAVTRDCLALMGRDLIRRGQSLHALRTGADGRLLLVPCSDWHWQDGDHDPATWRVRASAYGPRSTETWLLPLDSVVFVTWGRRSERPYTGTGPLTFASQTAKLGFHAERGLADEAAGPIAQLLAVPADGGGGGDDDPLRKLKADIHNARGKAALVETTAGGWGEGKDAAPRRDWQAARLGPSPPAGLVQARQAAFAATLAACGASVALFDDADGTAKREALRQWHMGTVRPLARILEAELSGKLGAAIRLRFDSYALDMVSRAQVVSKLVAAGVAAETAMAAVALTDDAL